MVPCRMCGREVAESGAACPHCGARRPSVDSFRMYQMMMVALGAISLGVAGYFALQNAATWSWLQWLVTAVFAVVIGAGTIASATAAVSGKDFQPK